MPIRRRLPRRPRRRLIRRIRRAGRAVTRRSPNGQMLIKRKMGLFWTGVPSAQSLIVSPATSTTLFLGTPEPVLGSNPLDYVYNVPFTMQFSLDQCLGYTEITNLFDRFKIKSVKVSVMCNLNAVVGSNQNPSIPALNMVYDPDDANTGGNTIAAIRERMGLRRYAFGSGNRPIVATFYPKPVMQVFRSAVSTGYASGKSMFIDSVTPDVPHYGVRGYIEGISLQDPAVYGSHFLTWDVTVTLVAKNVL